MYICEANVLVGSEVTIVACVTSQIKMLPRASPEAKITL